MCCTQCGFYIDLHEIKIFHFFLVKWAYSLRYMYECSVMPRNHVYVRTSVNRRYFFFFKIVYHFSCQVRRAANKAQNVWKILTKVSDEVCLFGLIKNSKRQFSNAGVCFSQNQKREIPKIIIKKVSGTVLIRILEMTEENAAPQSSTAIIGSSVKQRRRRQE